MVATRWFLASLLLAAACGSGTGNTTTPPTTVVPVASVTVSPSTLSLNPTQTSQLTAVELDSGGASLSGRTVTWSSSAPTVATVSASGLVTAVAVGSASVSATSEGKIASAAVTVAAAVAPVATVTVTPGAATLVAAQTIQLAATEKDAGGAALAGRTVTWSTAAPAVATVSATGLVTAVAVGSASITATSEGKSASATITIVAGTLVGAAGGTVVAAAGNVTIVIPAGALSQPTGITVTPITLVAGSGLVSGTSYTFGPDGTQFAVPVSVTIKYDPANIPAGMSQANLQLFTGSVDTAVMITGPRIDSVAHTVQGMTTHFSVVRVNAATARATTDDGVGLTLNFATPIVVCVGEDTELIFGGYFSGFGAVSVGSTNTSVAAVLSSSVDQQLTELHLTVDGLAPGSTDFSVRLNTSGQLVSVRTVIFTVTVTDQAPCNPVAVVAQKSLPGSDNIVSYLGGVVTPLTFNGLSANPSVGFSDPLGDPFAACGPQGGSCTLTFFGSGAPPPTTLTATPDVIEGMSFLNPTTIIFAEHVNFGVNSGKSDLWRVTETNGTPIRLTNLGAHVADPATTPSGKTFVEFYNVPQSGPTHIWSLMAPVGTNPVPVTTAVPVTSGSSTGEISPAISQNSNYLGFAQIPLDFSGSRIEMIDLGNPGAPPVPVSPATGYAFSPSWCGNEFLYYVWSQGMNGPYLLYRWRRVTGIVQQILALNAASYPAIAVARTNGDAGLHICPK